MTNFQYGPALQTLWVYPVGLLLTAVVYEIAANRSVKQNQAGRMLPGVFA